MLYTGLLALAGLSGLGLLFSGSRKTGTTIKLLLSFSGAFLLGISVLHLIPEVYDSAASNIGLFVLLGFLIQLLLEYFSKGLEHGHSHPHGDAVGAIPYGAVFSLCLHAFLEGMPLGHDDAHTHDSEDLLAGVVLHKIPVSFALASFLIGSNVSRSKTVLVILVFALMAPLGYLVQEQGLLDGVMNVANLSSYILAVVIGMLLHISTTILFESTENHRFNLIKFGTVLAGCVLAYLVS